MAAYTNFFTPHRGLECPVAYTEDQRITQAGYPAPATQILLHAYPQGIRSCSKRTRGAKR